VGREAANLRGFNRGPVVVVDVELRHGLGQRAWGLGGAEAVWGSTRGMRNR
jgi:hypothetical protein